MKNSPAVYRTIFKIIFSWILVLSCSVTVFAQSVADTGAVKNLLSAAAKYYTSRPSEKLYLNFDKPYYAVGDTAWFKAYVLTGDTKQASLSAKLYVEFLNAEGKLSQRLVLPASNGLAQGFIPMTEKETPAGNYTIRAYTNWLQNFGAETFFYKQISVGGIGNKTWLLTEQHSAGKGADSGKVQLGLRINDSKGLPVISRNITVRIQEGTKTILKSEMTTGVDGVVNGSLTLPAKANKRNLNIMVEDAADKSQRTVFPFYPSGADGDIDLQFLPEGGNLIAGLYNKVAFKAIGEDGLSRDVKGIIINTKGETVAELQTLHKGMGNFMLVPQLGETYTARVVVDGRDKKYLLPASKSDGLAVRVDGINHPDDLYVYISSAANDNHKYTLIAETRDKVYFGSAFTLNGEGYFNTHIAKSAFPTGIISLTILGADNKPVAQRRVFVDHHDALKIVANPGQAAYHPGDSIALALNVVSGTGMPVPGNFSVSVTDDGQVKDAAPVDNIQSHILLASELKGNFENAAWYFTADDEKLKEKALDNLLLTQGWQGFDWAKVNQSVPAPTFQAETEFGVTGTLRNLFNKPAAGLKVQLMAGGRQFLLMDTISDKQGRFAFKDLPLTDSVAYLIKLHNGKDRSAAADIKVDEFTPTTLKLAGLPRTMPWNINADTTLFNYLNKNKQRADAAEVFTNPGGGTLLKNVSVKTQRVAHFLSNEFAVEIDSISEAKLLAANKMTLMDLLQRELKGQLKESYIYALMLSGNKDGRTIYRPTKQFVISNIRINDLVVDGQSLGQLTMSLRDAVSSTDTPFTDMKENPIYHTVFSEVDANFFTSMSQFLNVLSAEDVKKIVVTRGRFVSIVITTRSGKGLNAAPSIGTYAYRPLPMQLPRQFYAPKYSAKSTAPDLRSTIHWEPNLVSDDKGNAQLSFWATGKPGTYTVNIEGTDMQGHFGVSTQKIVIK